MHGVLWLLRESIGIQKWKCIYYLKNNQLYCVADSKLSEPIFITDNVYSFIVQSENEVYYKDFSNTFWYKKVGEEAKMIAENVYDEKITFNDNIVFLTDYSDKSGTMYYSKNGKEKSLIAENVYSVLTPLGATYYRANYFEETNGDEVSSKSDFYFVTEDMDSKLLIEDCPCSDELEVMY